MKNDDKMLAFYWLEIKYDFRFNPKKNVVP